MKCGVAKQGTPDGYVGSATFVEIADAGGVTLAAKSLQISRSVVNCRLVRLEGTPVQLLSRTTRGAALTEPGMPFRDHAAKLCAEIDIAGETATLHASCFAGERCGRLSIAAPLLSK